MVIVALVAGIVAQELLCDCGAVRAEWTRLLAETPR